MNEVMMGGKSVLRSGVIPIHEENGRVYAFCMIPSNVNYGGDMPQMAKGHLEKGYSVKENALKESAEEIGLIEDNVTNIRFVGVFHKIAVFACHVKDKDRWSDFEWETSWAGWVDITDNYDKIREFQREIFEKARETMSERYEEFCAN